MMVAIPELDGATGSDGVRRTLGRNGAVHGASAPATSQGATCTAARA